LQQRRIGTGECSADSNGNRGEHDAGHCARGALPG
jgi:hypothetical protein